MNTPASTFDIEKLFDKIRQLDVHTPQGIAGLLAKESTFVFNYGDVEPSAAVSLTMPVRRKSYSSGALMSVFAMNRPEGYLRYIIEERLARFGTPSDMFLLFLAGRNQIGRLTYALRGEAVPEGEGEQLDELLSSPSGQLFERLVSKYALGSGISGVQPKTVVPLLPAAAEPAAVDSHAALPLKTVIVKAEGDDYPGIARNEFLCMSVAREAGFEVPDFWLSDDGLLFVMARFDRTPDGAALGFEDMSVLTGNEKYRGSYEMIARAVEVYTGADFRAQATRLFERVALSCFLRDGDAHMKNIGLLYSDPTGPRRLSPIYDVVCTGIYPSLDGRMALNLNKSKVFPVPEQLVAYGERLGLKRGEAEAVLLRIDTAFDAVADHLAADERYRADDLLSRIRGEVRRTGPLPFTNPRRPAGGFR
ncbi:type II toxin-antitoxin system HipA family toxin [Caballeronia sordidicola]|uniref:Protein hipA n=1 Tax=Caballeronia sordidicola TaxID=196367 RepID=A0A242MBZ7_CABSO|nr:type II toxin-antitoxin system HipA family toxin [Caballeronia sordidicola]OTP68816.1 Protein hipA [Caballeronia sordidicola]